MSYQNASQFSNAIVPPTGAVNPQFEFMPPSIQAEHLQEPGAHKPKSESTLYHGEALARDTWAEHYGPWVVLGFTTVFALLLLIMLVGHQVPGHSPVQRTTSDVLQLVGEAIGFFFCTRIALRLLGISAKLQRELLRRTASPNEMAIAHSEARAARRAFLAWSSLAFAIALYASGQAIWTVLDITTNGSPPFPGTYDVGFVASYPFFLTGTLLLTRRNKASAGRVRLLLDALAVIGAALALSWFFLLGPTIAGLAQQPSSGAAILSIYFPGGDLFLVAVGALLMFSPLANRAQQSVFLLLCMGLFFLAITDSLLGYYNLSTGFYSGTLQDVLWPLSLLLIGLAAIEYPHSIAREQEQAERRKNVNSALSSSSIQNRISQFSTTAQTLTPFILAIATCAVLLTGVANQKAPLIVQIEADTVALVLILLVIARQALTLMENNRLTMQMRGELVISRRELQVTRREADEATRGAQEKRLMEEGIAALREVHARVARGDLAIRAPHIIGPLLPIAISLNLMLDRLSAMSQRGSKYDQIAHECGMLQEAIERIGQGQAPWLPDQPIPQGTIELRAAAHGLTHLHRLHESQWRRLGSTLESIHRLTQRIRESLNEIRHSQAFSDNSLTNFERMAVDRMIREAGLLEQQERSTLKQIMQVLQMTPNTAQPRTTVVQEDEDNVIAPIREAVEAARNGRSNLPTNNIAVSFHGLME